MSPPRHPVTGRFLAGDCERDCLIVCAGPCGVFREDGNSGPAPGVVTGMPTPNTYPAPTGAPAYAPVTDRYADLDEEISHAMMDAGFLPVDLIAEDDPEYAGLDWIADRNFDAFRLERDGRVLLLRWSEDGIDLTLSTRVYVIDTEARFAFTPAGVAWFRSVVFA